MKLLFSAVSCTILAASVVAHDHHHTEQIPLDYVRFPYEATYQGSGGEGNLPSSSNDYI